MCYDEYAAGHCNEEWPENLVLIKSEIRQTMVYAKSCLPSSFFMAQELKMVSTFLNVNKKKIISFPWEQLLKALTTLPLGPQSLNSSLSGPANKKSLSAPGLGGQNSTFHRREAETEHWMARKSQPCRIVGGKRSIQRSHRGNGIDIF